MNLGPPDSAPSLAVDTTSSSPLLLPSSGVGYHLRGANAVKRWKAQQLRLVWRQPQRQWWAAAAVKPRLLGHANGWLACSSHPSAAACRAQRIGAWAEMKVAGSAGDVPLKSGRTPPAH